MDRELRRCKIVEKGQTRAEKQAEPKQLTKRSLGRIAELKAAKERFGRISSVLNLCPVQSQKEFDCKENQKKEPLTETDVSNWLPGTVAPNMICTTTPTRPRIHLSNSCTQPPGSQTHILPNSVNAIGNVLAYFHSHIT